MYTCILRDTYIVVLTHKRQAHMCMHAGDQYYDHRGGRHAETLCNSGNPDPVRVQFLGLKHGPCCIRHTTQHPHMPNKLRHQQGTLTGLLYT